MVNKFLINEGLFFFNSNKKNRNKKYIKHETQEQKPISHESEGVFHDFDASKGTEAYVTKDGHAVLEVFSPETT